MDATLEKLAAMVMSKDVALRAAAAKVLGELAPKDRKVVDALGRAASGDDPASRAFACEALGRIGTVEAAGKLVALAASGDRKGEDALLALRLAGAAAIGPVRAAYPSLSDDAKAKFAEAIARSGSPDALDFILERMAEEDARGEAGAAVRDRLAAAVSAALPGIGADAKASFGARLARALRRPSLRKAPGALARAAAMAGEIGSGEPFDALLEICGPDFPAAARAAAMRSLAVLPPDEARSRRLFRTLFPLLLDPKEANLWPAAVAALRACPADPDRRKDIEKLLSAAERDVREYAMAKLAELGSRRDVSDLVRCLDSDDRAVREEAARTLRETPAALKPLLGRLADIEDDDRARECAAICAALLVSAAGRGGKPPPSLAGPLMTAAFAKAGKRPEIARCIASVLRTGWPAEFAAGALAEARALRRRGDHAAATVALRLAGPVLDPAGKMELAFASLSSAANFDMSRRAREADPALAAISELTREGLAGDVAAAAIRDRHLPRSALYYVGFHLAEGVSETREAGARILREIVRRFPKSQEARQARAKLVLEGLEEPPRKGKGILERLAEEILRPADEAARKRAEAELAAAKRASQGKGRADKARAADGAAARTAGEKGGRTGRGRKTHTHWR
ncbi:MAG: HEAT repeat domain-containing protein [Planctomycetota bacterium]|nr:HEAT repeat domain-containing protein [Planctomycetota bacterium]